MNVSRKILGFALAVTLFATQFTAVMAYDDQPTTTPGKGGVLAHNVVDVTVPTALKLAFNPNGYTVNTGYTKIASDTLTPYSATATYYVWDSTNSVYKIKKVASADYAAEIGTGLYLARTSNEQVISLNYGIINKSTDIMDVQVDFGVTYDTSDAVAGGKTIEFVDTALDAKFKDVASATLPTGTGTAKVGEHKMYMTAVSAASAAITPVESYLRKNTWVDADTVYYYWDTTDSVYKLADTDGKFATEVDFNTALAAASTDYYIFSPTINPYTRKSELADVNMTAATAGISVFKAGTTNKADAKLIYSLDKAKYELKEGAFIEIGTTQDELAANLELNAVPGFTAFTIAGFMNSGADWTKAETKSITISPVYTLTVADGTENPVANTQKQVTFTPSLAFTDAGVITFTNMPSGSTVKAVTIAYTKDGKAKNADLMTSTDVTWNATYTQGTMTTGWTDYLVGCGAVTITYTITDGTTDTDFTATANF